MTYKKIITCYWDNEEGNTKIMINKELNGIEFMDFYSDILEELKDMYNKYDLVKFYRKDKKDFTND